MKVEQREVRAGLRIGSLTPVVSPTQGNGGMGTVREAQDHVGIKAAAEPYDFTALPPQGVMGVENRDESQRRLGQRGSVLWACLASAIGWCKEP